MSAYSPAMLILALEGVLVMAILSGTLLYLGMRKNRSDRAGATRLVGRIKKDEDTRREKLEAIFKSGYGLDGEALKNRVDEFITREKAFYKTLIALYLDRDSGKLVKLTEDLEEVIGPCLELAGEKPKATDANADVEELREQNDMLEKELQSTRRVMETLMAEYNAAFHKAKATAGAGAVEGEDEVRGETVELEGEPERSEPTGPVANLLKSGKKRDAPENDPGEAADSPAGETPPSPTDKTDGDHPDQGAAVTDKDIDRIMDAIDESGEPPKDKAASGG